MVATCISGVASHPQLRFLRQGVYLWACAMAHTRYTCAEYVTFGQAEGGLNDVQQLDGMLRALQVQPLAYSFTGNALAIAVAVALIVIDVVSVRP